jgi:hypothetical protein
MSAGADNPVISYDSGVRGIKPIFQGSWPGTADLR